MYIHDEHKTMSKESNGHSQEPAANIFETAFICQNFTRLKFLFFFFLEYIIQI